MSWKGYMDELIQSRDFDQGAVYSFTGDKCLYITSGWKIDPAEPKRWVGPVSDTTKMHEFWSERITIGGVTYLILADDDMTFLQAGWRKQGICIMQTKKAMFIGHYSEGVDPDRAMATMKRFREYVKSKGD